MTPSNPETTQTRLRPALEAGQVDVFKTITLDYFAKLAPGSLPPVIGEAFLQFEAPMLLDYTSFVRITGDYEGCVYLTVPRMMAEVLLGLHQETEISERTRTDICRELSNVLSGNASQAFGANWTISVPETVTRENAAAIVFPPATFAMPVDWCGARAYLVIGLHEREA